MTTPEQARKLADCYYDNPAIPERLLNAMRDLARQLEELQADAERYRYLKAYASDRHMWNDESIDAAIARIGK